MKREVGHRIFPIWLLGDSEPENWKARLDTPLDPRHPVRHSIWTPVLEVIQDRVFREAGRRVETASIYIRNAVADPALKPRPNESAWGQSVGEEIAGFQQLVRQYEPRFILCFGAFAFEFARRSLGESPARSYGYWGARRLGREFLMRTAIFGGEAPNLIPLLHRVVSSGKFLQAHDYFCGREGANYFDFVGGELANLFLEHREQLPIWIRRTTFRDEAEFPLPL